VLCIAPAATIMSAEMNTEGMIHTSARVNAAIPKAIEATKKAGKDTTKVVFHGNFGLDVLQSPYDPQVYDWGGVSHWSVLGHTKMAQALIQVLSENKVLGEWKGVSGDLTATTTPHLIPRMHKMETGHAPEEKVDNTKDNRTCLSFCCC